MDKISTEKRNTEISERVFIAGDALQSLGVLKPTLDKIKAYIREKMIASHEALGAQDVMSAAFRQWKKERSSLVPVQKNRDIPSGLSSTYFRELDAQVDSELRDIRSELSDAEDQIVDLISESKALREQNELFSNEFDALKSEKATLVAQNKQLELLLESEKARMAAAHESTIVLQLTIAELRAREVVTQERMFELKKSDVELRVFNTSLSSDLLQEKSLRYSAEKNTELLEDLLDQKSDDIALAVKQIESLQISVQSIELMNSRNVVSESFASDVLMQFGAIRTLMEQGAKSHKSGRHSRRKPKSSYSGSVGSAPSPNHPH